MITVRYLMLMFIISSYVFQVFSQNPEWINYKDTDEINNIAVNGNVVWIGTYGGGVAVYNEDSIVSVEHLQYPWAKGCDTCFRKTTGRQLYSQL